MTDRERALLRRYYDALRPIARGMKSPAELRRDPLVEVLGYEEVLEMAYENAREFARVAIGRRRRP